MVEEMDVTGNLGSSLEPREDIYVKLEEATNRMLVAARRGAWREASLIAGTIWGIVDDTAYDLYDLEYELGCGCCSMSDLGPLEWLDEDAEEGSDND